MNNNTKDLAARIAAMYLEKNPRKEFYRVSLSSSEDAHEGEYYHKLSKEEKIIISKWEEEQEDISLDDYLYSDAPELRNRLLNNGSLFTLDIIDSCNLNDVKKYSPCQIREYVKEKDKEIVYGASFPLTDEEFCMLLAERIENIVSLTKNTMVVNFPEFAQRIMKYLLYATCFPEIENPNPFTVIFTEIEEAAENILNPHIDGIGLFSCDDEELKNYAIKKQIAPPADLKTWTNSLTNNNKEN